MQSCNPLRKRLKKEAPDVYALIKDEPDFLEWTTEAGFPGRVVRNARTGTLCGYVGVGPAHPLFDHDYHIDNVDFDVHGGLTFSGWQKSVGTESAGTEWWFGFNCAHTGDLIPSVPEAGASYRDVAYVRREVESLAAQLLTQEAVK